MNRKIWIIAVFLALFTSACEIVRTPVAVLDPVSVAQTQQVLIDRAVQGTATTSALQTQVAALQTQVGQLTAVAGEEIAQATATLQPATATPLSPTFTPVQPTPTTQLPTATAVPPTPTFTPTFTPTVTSTNTPAVPCNQATFKADITIPDGTDLLPGTRFTKTWRLLNTGTCTWTTAYDLVFYNGDQMKAPAAVDLPGSVAPGQVIDLSVAMTAPDAPGSYRGNWMLRDPSGILFGVGKTSVPFYVDIEVTTPASAPLNMAVFFCSAQWTSAGTRLPCPGTDHDDQGFVLRVEKPVLETGYVDDEPALVTQPKMVAGSAIRGKYPAIRVEKGDHFTAIIGCAYQAEDCDVKFQLEYQIGDGSIQTLATWHEVYDDMFRPVDVDLSSLAGKDVKFILAVLSNNTSVNAENRAQWLLPRIVEK